MCLGIPGQVIETFHDRDLLMGKVDFGGVCKRVCLEHVSEVQPGEYVIVHVGFGLSIIDEQEARFVFDFLEKMNELEELNAGVEAAAPGSGGESRGPSETPLEQPSVSFGETPTATQPENAVSSPDPESAP